VNSKNGSTQKGNLKGKESKTAQHNTLTTYIHKNLSQELTEAAKRHGMSRSRLVVRLVKAYLKKQRERN
jgi:metal-responsive CopG/Arc/MetJ family transcriptional regulator